MLRLKQGIKTKMLYRQGGAVKEDMDYGDVTYSRSMKMKVTKRRVI